MLASGPKRRKAISAPMSAIGELSGLIFLTVSFVGHDPKTAAWTPLGKSALRRIGQARSRCAEFPVFETQSELIRELIAAGLDGYADQLGELARPCLHFAAASSRSGEAGSGAVRFGGRPELPEGMSWPYRPALPHAEAFRAWLRDDQLALVWGTPRPLTFFGQVDLARAAAVYPDPWPLPSSGRLYFFWDWVCGCFGQGRPDC